LRLESNTARSVPEDAIDQYVIDPEGSNFTVQAVSAGILAAFGHSPKIVIRDFGGLVRFDLENGKLSNAQLHLTIRADSLAVADNINEKDRDEIQRQMLESVLEVDRFPEIVYDCSSVTANGAGNRFWVTLNGELNLHGAVKPQPVTARLVVNGESLRASGEFSVRQSDYEIQPVTAVAGTIKLKDELKCTFDLIAKKQQ